MTVMMLDSLRAVRVSVDRHVWGRADGAIYGVMFSSFLRKTIWIDQPSGTAEDQVTSGQRTLRISRLRRETNLW